MLKHILADTSCLIFLEKIGRLDWLKRLYTELLVAQDVADEYGLPLPEFISVRQIQNQNVFMGLLSDNLGKGEAASLALALELENPFLILDDLKARKKANMLHVNYTGTPGILLLAKKKGLCEAVKPELDKLIQRGMWLSPVLYQEILKIAGE